MFLQAWIPGADESSNLNWSAKYKICVDAVEIVNDLLRSGE